MNFHTNGDGYSCENYDEEFKERIKMASKESFNKNPLYYAEGGSIPVVNIFSKLFPKSRIMVTGVLGPNSNAHGPDENIDISYLKQFLFSITLLINKTTFLVIG